MNRLIMIVATGGYVGLLPKAPGTWGSLAALLPWLWSKTWRSRRTSRSWR
jgi:phosphatidylglycerophosphatase A